MALLDSIKELITGKCRYGDRCKDCRDEHKNDYEEFRRCGRYKKRVDEQR
jgi:hypothetical protein